METRKFVGELYRRRWRAKYLKPHSESSFGSQRLFERRRHHFVEMSRIGAEVEGGEGIQHLAISSSEVFDRRSHLLNLLFQSRQGFQYLLREGITRTRNLLVCYVAKQVVSCAGDLFRLNLPTKPSEESISRPKP